MAPFHGCEPGFHTQSLNMHNATSKIDQAMILAAGFGTRLRPYTLVRPKPLFPVLNRPLLHMLLDLLADADCERIVVNGHHLADQVEAALAGYPQVHFQREEEILGTGGSLRRAMPELDDAPFLVMNGDIVHNVDLAALYAYHRQSGNLVTMALHDCPRFNTVLVDGDQVRGFDRKAPGAKLAFTGIHVVDPHILTRIPEDSFFHIIDLYQQLAREGSLGFVRVDGAYWQDMGTPEDYLRVHQDLLVGPAAGLLTGTGQRQGNWLIAEDARLGQDVHLDGWGCIGPGAEIGQGARLRGSVVWPGVRIKPGMMITDAIVSGTPETRA